MKNSNRMQTNNSLKLIEILEKKNISFNVEKKGEKKLFKSYSYYQVINAYKNLFSTNVEKITDIQENIKNNREIERYRKDFSIKASISDIDLFENICSFICSKYGLSANGLDEKVKFINKIDYHHHIYNDGPQYRDFVRMYKFEHELRLAILKYVLIIEESIKNKFIQYLNDNLKSADFLVNMKNYDTSSFNNKAFRTMRLIIDKHSNINSKPIKTKRDQELTIPYWILINELTMNETYYTILNLNRNDSLAIFAEITNFFTLSNIKVNKNRTGEIKISNGDLKLIDSFKSLLFYLGKFRNMLAHNQPIYTYNIEKYRIENDLKFSYEMPITKKNYKDKNGNVIEKIDQQYKLNGNLMRYLIIFFGKDTYNGRNQKINLNLSFMVYIINRMLKHIDKNNVFHEEITNIYKKYSIILIEDCKTINSIDCLQKHMDIISEISEPNYNVAELINKINSGANYKRELNKILNEYDTTLSRIKKSASAVTITKKIGKYAPFKEYNKYIEFTGIDKNFLNALSQ